MVRFSKKILWKIFNIYMEVIFHKNFCPKVIGSGFKNFTHTIKICKKKSMTAGSKTIFKVIFRIRDQKEFDLRKKIHAVRVKPSNLRHDRAQIRSFFDEILCVSFFHEYNCMIKFWGQNSKN